jgi:hypothetical protein
MQRNKILIDFEINGVTYSGPTSAKDIKIIDFVTYVREVVQLCPAQLDDVCSLEEGETIEGNFNKLSPKEKKECLEYFVKVVSYWTGAPEEDLKLLSLERLKLSFWALEYLFGNLEANENFTGFEVKGVEYLMPSKHMQESTLIEFAESAQFQEDLKELKAGNYIAILDIMSVLCRPKGEQYDEKNNAKRKKIFSSLSMDVAINVGFFLIRLDGGLSQSLAIYTLLVGQAAAEVEQLAPFMDGTPYS